MKSRLAGVALVISALLLTGCSPQPAPKPEPSRTPSASATPQASDAPASDVFAEPEAALDLDCASFAAEMEQLTGAPASEVVDRVSIASVPGWIPGPGEFFAQRAMGKSCSYSEGLATWEIVALPGAPELVAALTAEGYWFPSENNTCSVDYCLFEVVDGDVAVAFSLANMQIGEGFLERITDLVTQIASRASTSQRSAEVVASPIAGADCTQFITPEQVQDLTGVSSKVQETFGGWGYPAHAYFTVGLAKQCVFFDENGVGEYERDTPVMVTTLPAGAWAFDRIDGRTPVEVEGADKAYAGTGQYGDFIDILVGADWVRLTTSETVTAATDVASTVAQNLREIDWPGRVR